MVDIRHPEPRNCRLRKIERYITIPLEAQVRRNQETSTSSGPISLYGLSDVKLQFSFDCHL